MTVAGTPHRKAKTFDEVVAERLSRRGVLKGALGVSLASFLGGGVQRAWAAEAPLLGFNGTTEWALDSVTLDQALWLPREDQLRELLGDRLEAVRRLGLGWEVTYAVAPGYVRTVTDADLECAYARAVLAL